LISERATEQRPACHYHLGKLIPEQSGRQVRGSRHSL